MGEKEHPKITIAGAGLAGALLATMLGQKGYRVALYEKRPDLRLGEGGPGRSINLALSVRGVHALERAGLAETVLESAVAMPGRLIHGEDGSRSYQPYSKNPEEYINSVSRGQLNIDLLNAAGAQDNVSLHFNKRCVEADLDSPSADFVDGETGETSRVESNLLIGADGAFSAVRARMQRTDLFDYRQDYLEHGYKELTIPAAEGGGFRIEKNALHIWPRRSYMMIALPNANGSFTCTLFWPMKGPLSFDALETRGDVTSFFAEHFPDAVEHLPTLEDDYFANPSSSLVTVRCSPWHYQDKVVLVGDAAHAVVPFYGQGINAGFEDCEIFMDCVGEFAPDWGAVLSTYHGRRKKHVDTLARLAIANFKEMRDHVGSPSFLRKKKRERLLHAWFPGWYVPLYSMITFSRIPYAEAVRRARNQELKVQSAGWAIATLFAVVLMTLFLWIF